MKYIYVFSFLFTPSLILLPVYGNVLFTWWRQSIIYVAQFGLIGRGFMRSWIHEVLMNPESTTKVVIGEIMTQLWACGIYGCWWRKYNIYALPTLPHDRRMISTYWGIFYVFSHLLALREPRSRRNRALFSLYFPATGDKSVEKRNTPRIKFHS